MNLKNGVVKAHQWFKSGDHPDDDRDTFIDPNDPNKTFLGEGKVVRYYRRPEGQFSGQNVCPHCEHFLKYHGWIDQDQDGRVVCPGDWIITLENGRHFPVKPLLFEVLPTGVLSGAEAVIAFAGWLTTRKDPITFSTAHDSAGPCSLAKEFCKAQGLADPREGWTKFMYDMVAPE